MATSPIEERNSVFVLKSFDLLRHGRLCEKQFFGCPTEVKVASDHSKGFETEVFHCQATSARYI